MNDKEFWLIFGMLWLIASCTSMPESVKHSHKIWILLFVIFAICMELGIQGFKMP